MNNGEEVKTSTVRGEEVATTGLSDHRNRTEGIAPISSAAQHDASRLSGETGKIGYRENRRTIAGGMLQQLIEETVDQLQQNELQNQKLKSRLKQLHQLFEELNRKTGETMSVNSSEEE